MSNNMRSFDVLVVYENLAHSAADAEYKEDQPFSLNGSIASYNLAYEYLLGQGSKNNLQIGFSTAKDVIGAGTVSSYWTYTDGWKRHTHPAYSNIIYLKSPPKDTLHSKALDLLFSDPSIISFSGRSVSSLFQSKLKTYQTFPEFAIPTVDIGSISESNLQSAQQKLAEIVSRHPHKDDFGEELIIKDNFGSSGKNVIKVSKDTPYEEIVKKLRVENKSQDKIHYVLQPFVKYDTGFEFGDYHGMIDFRLWILRNKLIAPSIRIAKKGEFRANIYQGGSEYFLQEDQIPARIHELSAEIQSKIPAENSFIALDFICSNNGKIYFIEGNSSPGIDWTPGEDEHEKRQKQTIEKLIMEFKDIASRYSVPQFQVEPNSL